MIPRKFEGALLIAPVRDIASARAGAERPNRAGDGGSSVHLQHQIGVLVLRPSDAPHDPSLRILKNNDSLIQSSQS